MKKRGGGGQKIMALIGYQSHAKERIVMAYCATMNLPKMVIERDIDFENGFLNLWE